MSKNVHLTPVLVVLAGSVNVTVVDAQRLPPEN
nr:MAG TPA: hypothetical protein [Caudoviricetes sp.]